MAQEVSYVKNTNPSTIVGFFHGIDVASQNDYYTDIIHVLTSKPKITPQAPTDRPVWIPFLASMFRTHHRSPDEIIDIQIKLFNKFPPIIAKIDTTREDFLTSALVRKYGESTVIPVRFLNSGSSNTKYQLKQRGFSYLDAGYEWPDVNILEKTQPKFAKLIKILKKEMLHEQVKYTSNERVTFDHPIGKHNDMVHGWELSLDAVMEFQQRNLGYEKQKPEKSEFKTLNDETYKDYPTEENLGTGNAIYDQVDMYGINNLPDERGF